MVEYLSGGRIQGSSESGYPDGLSTLADLTSTGTISYTTGLAGKCIHCNFSGSESQGGTPAGNFFGQARTNTDDFNFIHTGGQAWTINFWIKPDSASLDRVSQLIGNMSYDGSSLSGFAFRCLDRRTQYGEENKFTTVFENNGNIVYSAFNGANGNIPDDTNWHMITVRSNGTNTSGATAIDICIDGGTNNNDFTTPQGTCTRSANTCNDRNASYGLLFGRNLYNQWGGADAYYNWDGSFDEVSIWNRELSDSECVALYNSGSGAVTTTAVTNHSGLKAYWNFNDQMENQAKPVDEKDSLNSVPANSRYEEYNTRKIFRRTAGTQSYNSTTTNVTLSNSNLTATSTSTAWGNRAYSTVSYNPTNIPSGETREFKFTMGDITKNGFMGFDKTPTTISGHGNDNNASGVDYGMYLVGNGSSNNYLEVSEQGTNKYQSSSNFITSNTIFKITVDSSGVVKYYADDTDGTTLRYTSLTAMSGDFYVLFYPYDSGFTTTITSWSNNPEWKERNTI